MVCRFPGECLCFARCQLHVVDRRPASRVGCGALTLASLRRTSLRANDPADFEPVRAAYIDLDGTLLGSGGVLLRGVDGGWSLAGVGAGVPEADEARP